MDGSRNSVEFELAPAQAGGRPLCVRMDLVGDRWVARVREDAALVGMALSAREALSCALEPLGDRRRTRVMASLELLPASISVLEVERAQPA
jgi:hypothetical protein